MSEIYTPAFSRTNDSYRGRCCTRKRRYSVSGSSRQASLKNLAFDIREGELTAAQLLRTFDIDLDSGPVIEHSLTTSASAPSACVLLEINHSDGRTPGNETFEHPFLSTPLRLKHFPRISPSVLRGILRSPSLRAPTPDGSFSDDMSSLSVYSHTSDLPALYRPSVRPDSQLQKTLEQDFCPLTPPLTARPPCLSRFPTLVGADFPVVKKTSRDEFVQDVKVTAHIAHTRPQDAESDLETQRHRSSSIKTHDVHPYVAAGRNSTLLSSTALLDHRRVVDELKGIDGNTSDDRRRTLVSSLRICESLSEFPFPQSDSDTSICSSEPGPATPPSSSSPNLWIDAGLKVESIDGPRTKDPSSLQAYPHSRVRMRSGPLRNPGSLDLEFTRLLLQRAAEEEEEAEELRLLAQKLEKLAKGRRELAKVVAQGSNGKILK